MTRNAALVNAGIAELMGAERFCADDALVEAMRLDGARADEHGVFCRHERFEIANARRHSAF